MKLQKTIEFVLFVISFKMNTESENCNEVEFTETYRIFFVAIHNFECIERLIARLVFLQDRNGDEIINGFKNF
jgi:hypothetical protein